MNTKFEILLRAAKAKKIEITALKVWLINYENGKKTVVHSDNHEYRRIVSGATTHTLLPKATFSFDNCQGYGNVQYQSRDEFPELFDAVHKVLLKRLADTEASLAEIQAKIEAVEELLKG